MKQQNIFFCLVIYEILLIISCNNLLDYQDAEILYKINWPGKVDLGPDHQQNFEYYPITTAKNEKYACKIPTAKKEEKNSDTPYKGPNPIELLTPLFEKNTCLLKSESYWSYEICHGKYVKQYHEEREGKQVKLQKYYLGYINKTEKAKLLDNYSQRERNRKTKFDIPMKKLDGIRMPYVEVQMTNGTVCDLSNKPRNIKLLYICHPQVDHEIYSLDEVASCEYEAIIMSRLLCSHPDYSRTAGEDEINCIPLGNSLKRPRALSVLETESLKLRQQKFTDGEPRVRIELRPTDGLEKKADEYLNSILDVNSANLDIGPHQNFLEGKRCLHGGDGWWKYEFCYGRSVSQYHVEKNGVRITIDLGNFNQKKHIEWIEAHPNKRPKPIGQRKQLSHFYSDGSFCDKTGRLRQTEVRLKCVDNALSSPSSVSLFLLEPKICEYILGVESPLICNMLEYADETGLINDDAVNNLIGLNSKMSQPSNAQSQAKIEKKEKMKILNDEL
ncbi:hypothetical protein PV327_007400 [Microctonus hyperodae]|uniref:Endoplasmic reticulum lectin 1 n=1 Tax=Microctonus hyperodae TaxID=165561 RepID=A0AA39FZS8_MICHY|nr:hypothetical protein PV327_007400 [Microctonus hyperodae]